jgi:DNA ligase-1
VTLIRPPSLNKLIKTYGSLKAAVHHLLDSGYSPEDISWRMNVPYHHIRLYMDGSEPSGGLLFLEITKLFERLALLRSKRGKETELANFFKRKDLGLELKTRLALGKIVDESFGIGPGLIERAIGIVTGTSPKKVKKLLIDYGEHGEVAFLLLSEKDPTLTVNEVYKSIRLLPRLSKIRERDLLISSLLDASTPIEAKYIMRLLLFNLKLGYYERTVIRAAAKAYKVPVSLIESVCAIIGLTEGIMVAAQGTPELEKVRLRPGQFLKPQLAHIYEPEKVNYPCLVEVKLDGNRLQIHKWGTRIWLFSRSGKDKTETYRKVSKIGQSLGAHSCIVDGEVVAVDSEGKILPFQRLLRISASTPSDGEEPKRSKITASFKAFDLVYMNGRKLSDLPFSERRRFLVNVVPHEHLVESTECFDEVELMKFYEHSLQRGYEGIVIKDLKSLYEFGRRTYSWIKLKPERDTLDCTVVKAFFGKGKHAGFYSSFLMAIRDPTEKKLFTIGKVSNLSEALMERLKNVVETSRIRVDDEGVFVKPSIVIETTYHEIQTSEEYTSGYALRVPKIVRFKLDKSVDEIDTIEKTKQLYESQYERELDATTNE